VSEFRLHCFAQSGNAYKTALLLELAGASWEPVFVDYFHDETRQPDYRAKVNEMGEAPVLEHRDLKLTQSGVILDYLASALGRFGPETEEERREILRWTLWDNHKLTSYIATWRFMMAFMPEEKRDQGVLGFLEGRSRNSLAILDGHLARRPWILGDRMTTADFSCVGYLFFDNEWPVDLARYPNVLRWRDAIAALPRWKHPYDLMPGHPIPGRT
jgi:glutathione S-transferase